MNSVLIDEDGNIDVTSPDEIDDTPDEQLLNTLPDIFYIDGVPHKLSTYGPPIGDGTRFAQLKPYGVLDE